MRRKKESVFEIVRVGEKLPSELRNFIKRHTIYSGVTSLLGGDQIMLRNIMTGVKKMTPEYMPHLEHLIKEAQERGLEARKQENKINAYAKAG